MKTVVNSREVSHLWAHKTQPCARNGRGSVFFEGDTIYSYGRHFPIARHVTIKNKPAVLFTTRRYSVTTSHHVGMVRHAIPYGLPVIEVDDVRVKPTVKFLDDYQERINEAAKKAKRSRLHKEWALEQIEGAVEEFKKIAELFDSDRTPVVPDDEWIAEQRKIAREISARESEARKGRERIERERMQVELEKWKNGEGNRSFYGLGFDYMRIDGDQIETTQGATVPLEHVKKVAPLILRLLAEGKTYKRNGHSIHLGHYVIDRLDEEGTLWVGCHRFAKDELLRIASHLNALEVTEKIATEKIENAEWLEDREAIAKAEKEEKTQS